VNDISAAPSSTLSKRYYERAITLPISPNMGDEDIEDVIEAVRKVIAHYRN